MGTDYPYYADLKKNADTFTTSPAVKRVWDTTLKKLTNNFLDDSRWTPEQRIQFTKDAMGTRAILHADMVPLLKDWLGTMKTQGSKVERKLYQNMDFVDLFDRLLTKRPIAFLNSNDYNLPRKGARIKDFGIIGTEEDTDGKLLGDYMSYKEMQLS